MSVGQIRDPIKKLLRRAASQLLGPLVKKHVPPGLEYLVRHAASVASDAHGFISEFCPDHQWEAIQEEYLQLETKWNQHLEVETELPFPEHFAVGVESRRLIYHLIRWLQPDLAVETGVANGCSTFFILKALETNDSGELHSFDIREDAGALVEGIDHSRWNFHLVEGSSPSDTVRCLKIVKDIDFFLHVSYHSFQQQHSEYRAALERLSPQGILASDDIDKSFAFVDLCKDHSAYPSLLVDTVKVFGAIRVQEMIA